MPRINRYYPDRVLQKGEVGSIRRFAVAGREPLYGTCSSFVNVKTGICRTSGPWGDFSGIGGGSGHGFKHGPAIGAHVASLVLGERTPEAAFALGRFARAKG